MVGLMPSTLMETVQIWNQGDSLPVTERKSLFEPCGHRITVGPGMEGVQGEVGEKSFHLGVI
jgi:hypothetical protein